MQVEVRVHEGRKIVMIMMDRGFFRKLFNMRPVLRIFSTNDGVYWTNDITGIDLIEESLCDKRDLKLIKDALGQYNKEVY